MNLYLRYFDREILVHRIEDAVAFLSEIPGFEADEYFVNDFVSYVNGPVQYPKRYKVRSKAYFIVIKTKAATLEEFKANGAAAPAGAGAVAPAAAPAVVRERRDALHAERIGWYEAAITFNRVLANPQTGKARYFSTEFVARVKAVSPQDSYDRVVDYLRHREDVDERSQFPSIKGRNFHTTYLGLYPEN